MLLNRLEWLMMNNPVRSAAQRHLEVPRLLRMGGAMMGGRALEVGCGRGVGTELIFDYFRADSVDAFDLDPSMVELARRRLLERGDAVRVNVGDACKIDAPDACYDAAFDFGILHHVERWRDALSEIHRVLKPGARLYAEEIFARFTSWPPIARLLEHPKAPQFGHDEFRSALAERGVDVDASWDFWGLGGFFVGTRA